MSELHMIDTTGSFVTATYSFPERFKLKEAKINIIKEKPRKKVALAYPAFTGCFRELIPDLEVINYSFALSKLQYYDLILFSGGEDINPEYYGEKNRLSNGINKTRDSIERDVFSIARQYDKKIAGFCRGHQLINVLEGGNLYQDYASEGAFQYHPGNHNIEDLKGNIKNLFSGYKVVSCHHQAVKNIAESLVATSMFGGIVESLESKDGKIISTQFHPEFDTGNEQVKNFFKFLLEDF